MIPVIPWKLVAWVGLLVGLSLMGWRVTEWHKAYLRLSVVEKALKEERECSGNSECSRRQKEWKKEAESEKERVVTGYEAELAAVRSRQPVTVRLCNEGSVRVPTTAGGANAAPPTAGVVPGSLTGDRDVGPELSALALKADEVTAQCRALIGFNRAMGKGGR